MIAESYPDGEEGEESGLLTCTYKSQSSAVQFVSSATIQHLLKATSSFQSTSLSTSPETPNALASRPQITLPSLQNNGHLLARHIHSKVTARRASTSSSERKPLYLHGIAGVPGCGKTSTAKIAAEFLNEKLSPRVSTKVLSMDGFHYYRRELDKFDDPKEAHKRRGAPFTFNAARFVRTLEELREKGCCVAPSFDHRRKDPDEGAIAIGKDVEAVIIEGNYLLLDTEPWNKIKVLLDEVWFLEVKQSEADRRVVQRHVKQIGLTWKGARLRVAENDRPNANLISKTKPRADFVIYSGS